MGENSQSLDERKFRWERIRFLIASFGGTLLFFIGLWQFTITARNDFAKPVLEKQLELCMDATESAALLAQTSNSPESDWKSGDVARGYLALYYGKLGVVEDRCLYDSMVGFKRVQFDGIQSDTSRNRLALTIAFACRRLISKNWSPGLAAVYDPQRLFESFSDLEDYKNTMGKYKNCALDN